MNELLKLTIPADPAWVLAMRLAMSAAGALCNVTVDVLDDLRMAVDEACDVLMHQRERAARLTLLCAREGDMLHLHISAERAPGAVCSPDSEEGNALSLGIMQTLVPVLHFDSDACGVYRVRMALRAQG